MIIKEEIMEVSTRAEVGGTERREKTLRKQQLGNLVSGHEKENIGRYLALCGRKKQG